MPAALFHSGNFPITNHLTFNHYQEMLRTEVIKSLLFHFHWSEYLTKIIPIAPILVTYLEIYYIPIHPPQSACAEDIQL